MARQLKSLVLIGLFLMAPLSSFAHELENFEYICSVYQRNKEGRFSDVINVVFLPEWQKKSHLWTDSTKDIWFEIVPVHNGMGEIEGYEMELRLYLNKSDAPTLKFIGPQFSEIGFDDAEHNIGSRCFHRSQRGNKK